MKVENFILRVLVGFNIATLILYIFSPFTIDSGYKFINVLFISLNIFMINLGFKSGLKRTRLITQCAKPNTISQRTFHYILIFYILTFTLRYSYLLYTPPFNITALVNRIMIGVYDPQAGRLFDHGARTLPWVVYLFTSIIDSIFFIIAFLKWKGCGRTIRYIIVLLVIFDLFFWRSTGTNFGTFMLLTSMLFSIFASNDKATLNQNATLKYISIGLLGCFSLLFVFSVNMEGRAGGDFAAVDYYDLFEGCDVSIADNHVIYESLPYSMQVYLTLVFSYLTQGYMFLEYLYTLEFHWGGFFGNNPGLQSLAHDFLWFDPEVGSYQLQIEQFGVDHDTYWHSCYLWLANDFTIIGVPIIIFLISQFCSSALVMYRRTNDLSSGIVFIVFATMLIFLFANNNYLSTVLYSFMFVFPYWLFKKYKR